MPASTVEPANAAIILSRRLAAAQRRHLTVMFCDLVGSTDLAVRIDPEDLSDILRQYQRACEQVICRYGGYVARYMGDGLLVYFGYPGATEHDPERAVRAGLDVIESVRRLRPGSGLTLHTRIGIASGAVVVGEVVGDGASRQETVVGETPNLAARLQELCSPDTVVISGRTHKLIGGLFEYIDLGYPSLKGFDKRIHAYAVAGESAVQSRFEATHLGHTQPLVGRGHELQLLQESWGKACTGVGQLVSLCGEPGIGKSHLLEQFRASLAPNAAEIIRLYGSPHTAGATLHPIIAHWKRLAGICSADSASVQLDKLARRMAHYGPYQSADFALMASLLSLPSDGRYDAVQLGQPERSSRIIQLLLSQVSNRCRSLPVVLIMEDLHWLDAGTLEVLDRLVQELKEQPLLIIVTHRTEFGERWKTRANVRRIVMTRLESRAARAIIDQLTGGRALPEKIVADIVENADGVPLFLEELTKSILENPLLSRRGEAYTVNGCNSQLLIPATLQDALMSRLDRLAGAREVAQIASALGREFSIELLRAVADLPAGIIDAAVEKLVASELLTMHGIAPNQSYAFRHILVQEAAYESMLRSTRRLLHARIAEILQEHFSDQVKNRPELLSHHYAAVDFYGQDFRNVFGAG